MGFCVARTKKGSGNVIVVAAHRAGKLLHRFQQRGLRLGRRAVDFIRQNDVAEDGPWTNVQRRWPVVGSSSIISVPVISEGIRSGVNWMRVKTRPSVCAMVRTMSVLAVPGRPVMRQWPPDEEPDENLVEDFFLSDDHLPDLGENVVPHGLKALNPALELG